MATHDFYRALLEQWDDVLSRLSDQDTAQVHGLVTDVVNGRRDRDDVLVDLVRVLAPVLRQGDPVLAALRSDRSTMLETGPDAEVEAEFRRIVARLGDVVLRSESERQSEAPHSPEAVWRRARRRLLALPHLLEPPPVGNEQGGAADDGLIRLPRADGGRQLPHFQFDDARRPHDLVVRVNRLLDAEDDPWGVADWWVSPHAVLGDPPVALLGTAREAEVWAAASALGGHRA